MNKLIAVLAFLVLTGCGTMLRLQRRVGSVVSRLIVRDWVGVREVLQASEESVQGGGLQSCSQVR